MASLPDVPDVGIVLLGAERAHLAVRELAARGTAAAIVLASGYTETGEEGARRQKQLMEAAGSMRILGPNTIGLVNLTDNIVLSATGALEMEHFPGRLHRRRVAKRRHPRRAAVARRRARHRAVEAGVHKQRSGPGALGFHRCTLPTTTHQGHRALCRGRCAIPQSSARLRSRRARAGKPIVAFKIGRSEAGAKAAVSHTGALAGADRMYDALFRQTGVIRAQTFDELLDIPAALATGRKLRGNRVAILTSTGGAGTLVSDSLGVSGFETPRAGCGDGRGAARAANRRPRRARPQSRST